MPKHLLEDMVKTKSVRKENKEKGKQIQPPNILAGREIGVYTKKKSRYYLWFIALISVVFCFFAISFLFAKANVIVNPKTQDVAVNENLSASKDSNASGLSFDLVVISGAESKNIQATGVKDIKVPATGTVVLYNAFSASPQPLNIDTRLEGSNGKIYKTQTKIIVPGMSKDGTPGSIQAGIYGAETGAEYNSDPLDFKIFGFKGTSKYTKIYGRSKGTISGGFNGQGPVVSDADKATAEGDLKTALQAKLLQKATDQIPSGFILFKNATFLSADDSNISSTYNKDNSLTLAQSGTLYGILFNEQKLAKKISEDNIDKYDESDIYIPNIRDLTFTLSNQDSVSFDSVQNIDFNLSGPAKVVWKLDLNKFTGDILGRSKNEFNQILSQYPNVSSATLTISPIWKMSIPDQAKNVKVIVNYPPHP